VPSHAIVPHSRIIPLAEAFQAFLAARAEVIARHKIETGFVVFAVGANAILFEPMFYWPGAAQPYHHRMIDPAYFAKLPVLPPDPEADGAMRQLREALLAFWAEQGCAHLQIGKSYQYLQTREPGFRALLEQLKSAVDPGRMINPGSLGLTP
jgi:hypothetical protein